MTVQRDYAYSMLCHASFEAVRGLLHRFTDCAVFASALVDCAIVENGVDETTVGCARRVIIRGMDGALRETLVGQCFAESRCVITTQLSQALEGAPRRCAISKTSNLISTLTVHRLSEDPLKCFVEFYATYDTMEDDAAAARAFLHDHWGRPFVKALADYALKVEFPSFTVARPARWNEFEDCVVRHVVRASDSTLEHLLDAYRVAHEDAETERQKVSHLRSEIQSRDLLLAAAAATTSQLSQQNERLELQLLLARHPASRNDEDVVVCESRETEPVREVSTLHAAPPPAVSTQKFSRPTVLASDEVERVFASIDVHDQGFITVNQLANEMQRRDNCTDLDVALRTRGKTTSREEMYLGQARSWLLAHCRDKKGLTIGKDEFALFLLQAKRW